MNNKVWRIQDQIVFDKLNVNPKDLENDVIIRNAYLRINLFKPLINIWFGILLTLVYILILLIMSSVDLLLIKSDDDIYILGIVGLFVSISLLLIINGVIKIINIVIDIKRVKRGDYSMKILKLVDKRVGHFGHNRVKFYSFKVKYQTGEMLKKKVIVENEIGNVADIGNMFCGVFVNGRNYPISIYQYAGIYDPA
jgi:hypothetical protein